MSLPSYLYDYQKPVVVDTLKFFRDNEESASYMGADMGTGKTVMSIGIMDFLTPHRTIIVCPASVMFTWEEEIKKFSEYEHDILVVDKSTKIKTIEPLLEATVIIISHRMVLNTFFKKHLEKLDFGLMVVDEAHKIKGRNSSTANVLCGRKLYDKRIKNEPVNVWDKSKYRLCLSGTPISGNTDNAYVWFGRMAPKFFPNYYEFAGTFCNVVESDWGTRYVGIKNGKKLNKIIRRKFFTRIKKEIALKELPPKIYQKIYLPEEYSRKVQMQKEIEAEILEILADEDTGKLTSMIHAEPVARYRREQGLLKVPKVVEFIGDLLDDGEPCLLFAHHIAVVEELTKALAKYNPVVITGATPAKKRTEAVANFQDGKTNLFIGNITASGAGLNLYRAHHVLFAEDPWNPDDLMQAEDRAHRKGQKGYVTVYNFVVKNSIDIRVMQVLRQKMKAHNEVVDNEYV